MAADIAPRIALGVVPVLAILDPEVIVLGGPIGAAGGAELATLVSRAIERDRLWKPRITTTALSGAKKSGLLRNVRPAISQMTPAAMIESIPRTVEFCSRSCGKIFFLPTGCRT